jgi:hypothetical protein
MIGSLGFPTLPVFSKALPSHEVKSTLRGSVGFLSYREYDGCIGSDAKWALSSTAPMEQGLGLSWPLHRQSLSRQTLYCQSAER